MTNGLVNKNNYCYYYLHTNGTLISKPVFTVETYTTPEEYFDSDFVVKYWKIDLDNKTQIELMLKEVKKLVSILKGGKQDV